MLISIIMPVYNAETYLCRSIDSVLSQSFTDFELILVDDGSKDNSGEICDSYAEKDSRIHVIHQKNGGAASARNTGLDYASGKWIAFIDSDDWVHPDFLRTLWDTAQKTDADITACRYKEFSDYSELFCGPVKISVSENTVESYWVGDRTGATVPWGKLYDRTLFEGCRYPVGRIGEDEFVTYKILFGCRKLVVIDVQLYYYYTNPKGISKSDYFKRFPDIMACFEEHEKYFKNSPWRKAYRLEVEKYAEGFSNAIWLLKDDRNGNKQQLRELRMKLKRYLSEHKGMIPFDRRKDIYIAAFPKHELFIRGIGFLKRLVNHE